MRETVLRASYGLLLFFIATLSISSQGWSADKGTAALPFLKLGVGARALGMGGAYAAPAQGVDALYWNPAGLGRLQRPEMMFTYNPLVEGIAHNQAALAFKAKGLGVGAGYNGLSYSSIDAYDASGNRLSTTFKASDQAFALGLSLGGEKVAFGLGGKYIRSSIDGTSVSGGAGEAGLNVLNKWIPCLRHALVVKNIGGKVSFIRQEDPLPTTYTLGNLLCLGRRFMLAADVSSQKGSDAFAAGGFEWSLFPNPQKTVALRGGFSSQRSEAEKLAGASFGLGIALYRLSLDYAWIPYGELGDTHAVTVLWRIPPLNTSARSRIRQRGLRKTLNTTKDQHQEPVPIDTTGWMVITLDNGKQIEGQVVKETAEQYHIRTDKGGLAISKAKVKKVEPYKPGRKKTLGTLE